MSASGYIPDKPKPRKLQAWAIERGKRRGSPQTRAAALALYAPIEIPDSTRRLGNSAEVESAAGSPLCSLQGQGEPAAAGFHTGRKKMASNTENLKNVAPRIDVADVRTAQGAEMAVNLSAGFLNRDAKNIVKRSVALGAAEEVFCGHIWGTVEFGMTHPNNKDPSKLSTRWHGVFGWSAADGRRGEAETCYLQTVAERYLRSLNCPVVGEFDRPPLGFAADFSIEVWCVEDTREDGQGFRYRVNNRAGRRRRINHLAPPEVQKLLPPEPPPVHVQLLGYDMDTGEIIEDAEPAHQEAAE